MPLTVADAIRDITLLSAARVVGGETGLNKIIRWTHIVDFPEVAPWVRPGDLLLTTAFALKDNPSMQLELIPNLVEKGLSGLMVAVGRYFYEIPQGMISLADSLSFPVITIPFEVPFVEVTHAIHSRICNEQHELLEKAFRIHRVLTELVLQDKGLEVVAESLAKLLNRSVTIEDASFRLLAYAALSAEDEIRKRTIAQGRTPEEIIAYLGSKGLFQQIRENPGPQRVTPIPALGLDLERIVAPILVGAHLFGYVWIIAAGDHLTELDFQAIESAAIVAALILSRQQAIYETEQRVKESLLNNLLDAERHRDIANVTDVLQKLGLHDGYTVLVFEEISGKPFDRARLGVLIKDTMQRNGVKATVIDRGKRFITLLGTPDALKVSEAARGLAEVSEKQGYSSAIGIGTSSHDPIGVRQCYEEAIEALQIGRTQSNGKTTVWLFSELGILHWLHTLPPNLQSTNRYYAAISELAEYDKNHGTSLLKTLEFYLNSLGNRQKASHDLYIHRNTLGQRLEKIDELCKVDLRDSNTILNLVVAIKGWRLSHCA